MEEVVDFHQLLELLLKEEAISGCPQEMRNGLKKTQKTLADLNELGNLYVAMYGYKLNQTAYLMGCRVQTSLAL